MPNPADGAAAPQREQKHEQGHKQGHEHAQLRTHSPQQGQDPSSVRESGRERGREPEPEREDGHTSRPEPESGSPLVRYVFAVGRAGDALDAAADGLPGPAGAPVRTVGGGGGLGALVSDVPAGLYDEAGLKAQLEDMERLETLARSHHDVVAAAYRHTAVLPMRLATVYLDDDRVAAMLAERSGEFDALLSRLEGHVEWGVKVYADPGAAAPAEQSAEQPAEQPGGRSGGGAAAANGSSPGRAYLRQRRRQRSTHRDTYRAAGAVAERAAALADGLATAKVSHRPQQGQLAAGPGENIVNDAYLVPSGRSEDFRAAIGGLAEDVPGVRVETTGPWAPYSFATPPSAPQRQPAEAPGAAGAAGDAR